MAASLNLSLQNAVKALQGWYAPGSDSYASMTGLYHWDDPDIVGDLGGDVTVASAENELLKLYGYTDAFQDTERWWNNANAITALIDYMLITNDRSYLAAVENTFSKAPNAFTMSVNGVEVGAISGAEAGAAAGAAAGVLLFGPIGGLVGGAVGAVIGFFGGGGQAAATTARIPLTNFLNPYYDDEGWWALTWIKAYDLTGDARYLSAAKTIFTDITTNNADQICGGGIYWTKTHTDAGGKTLYKNAIANELYLALAASLAVRTQEPSYLNVANAEWTWFKQCGLINTHNMINDSFSETSFSWTCTNDGSMPVWTYNQGVILGALCQLFLANQFQLIQNIEPQLLDIAEQIADALIQQPYLYMPSLQTQIGNNTTASMPFVTSRPTTSVILLTEDWVYFRGTDTTLWRVKGDGTHQTQVGNNKTASTPFVTSHGSDDWVYFQGTDNKLWRIKWDGTQQSQIGNNDTASMPFVMPHGNDDWVYFQGTDNELWRVKWDGTQQSQVGNNKTASTPFVTSHGSDDWVYFQGTDNKLWRIKWDGTQQSQIGNNDTASMPFVMPHGNDDWVYFQGTDNKLWRVKWDGTQQSQVGSNTTASSPFVMSVYGADWIYFQGTDNKLWRVKWDGTQQSQIGSNTTASSPFVASDGWLYFEGTDNKLWRVFLGPGGASVSGVNATGILTEFNDNDPHASVDSKQFKGVFMRNLGYLYKLRPRARYRAFILKNAMSVKRNSANQFGGNWSAPTPDTTDFVRQTAGVDLLNAANAVPPEANYESLLQFITASGFTVPVNAKTMLNGITSLRSVMRT